MPTPATTHLIWTRGNTAEFGFRFKDSDDVVIGGSPIMARMQVRTIAGKFGTTTAATLLLDLSTEGVDPKLTWETLTDGVALVGALAPEDHDALNPDNAKKVKYAFSVELYLSDEYVRTPVEGTITVRGETTR